MQEPVRVNTRISATANAWLDKKAYEMGASKSFLISMAVENFIKESEVVQVMPNMVEELKKHGVNI